MYGGSIKVRYGAYIQKISIECDIAEREAENRVREMVGVALIGEGWVNETRLFKIVEKIFPNKNVFREASPDWLGNQRLDIYIPELQLAIEYQGEQHYRAINHFGGEDALAKTKARDKQKKKACDSNGVSLIYVKYNDDLSTRAIKNKLREVLDR